MYMWQWLPEKDIPNIFGFNVLWMCCGTLIVGHAHAKTASNYSIKWVELCKATLFWALCHKATLLK
jgi:hypothetical protein